jgi:hypothetical protein
MNDHDAMDAVNVVLDQWFTIKCTAVDAMQEIAKISGMNRIDHEAAK